MGGTTVATILHIVPIRRDWCAFFMSYTDDSIIEEELGRLNAYSKAKDSVMGSAVKEGLSDSAKKYADSLIENGWDIKKADRFMKLQGAEVWTRFRPGEGKLKPDFLEADGPDLIESSGRILGKDGLMPLPTVAKEKINLRGIERYG